MRTLSIWEQGGYFRSLSELESGVYSLCAFSRWLRRPFFLRITPSPSLLTERELSVLSSYVGVYGVCVPLTLGGLFFLFLAFGVSRHFCREGPWRSFASRGAAVYLRFAIASDFSVLITFRFFVCSLLLRLFLELESSSHFSTHLRVIIFHFSPEWFFFYYLVFCGLNSIG